MSKILGRSWVQRGSRYSISLSLQAKESELLSGFVPQTRPTGTCSFQMGTSKAVE